jgi:hypothetical protein
MACPRLKMLYNLTGAEKMNLCAKWLLKGTNIKTKTAMHFLIANLRASLALRSQIEIPERNEPLN